MLSFHFEIPPQVVSIGFIFDGSVSDTGELALSRMGDYVDGLKFSGGKYVSYRVLS